MANLYITLAREIVGRHIAVGLRTRMLCITGDGSDEGETDCEAECRAVADLLPPQYALATGGRARDLRPVITFPDRANFHTLAPAEYQRLLLYLTSVLSLIRYFKAKAQLQYPTI